MDQAVVDYRKKWKVMTAVAMGVFLATIDGSIVNIALPTLIRAFDTQFAVVQWVVLAYLLTIATMMLTMGRLADIIGRKPLYLSGFVVFTIGSALCGFSQSEYWLIGSRVFQALGAAMMFGLGTAIITEAFPTAERGKALGIIGSVVSIGIITGPVLGGFLIDALSWHWIFFVNLPIGLAGSLITYRFVPDTKFARKQRFDFAGAGTLFISLASFLLALTLGQRMGFQRPLILSLFTGWLIFSIVFLWIEWRVEQPLVDLSLFRRNLLSVNLLSGFLTFVSIAGAVLLMPFYLENVLHYSPRQVGMLLAVVPLMLGIVSPISGSLSDRYGTRPITVIGLTVLLFGYACLTTLNEHTTAPGYVLRFMPVGIGMAIFQSPNNSAIMGAAPIERLGIVSGLLSLTRTLGQTTGIALLGAIWAGRTAYYGSLSLSGGAAKDPTIAQVSGLNDTFMVIVALIGAALLLSAWAMIKEKTSRAHLAKDKGF